ncbi:MAG: 2-C-methyl-D-erythritol 4-phosphate cytidylyltransferase [Granulosicoccus sp.]
MSSELDAPLWVVVPAAGQGLRFGAELPKQYLRLAGLPMLQHTLSRLLSIPGLTGLVAVIARDDDNWQGIHARHDERVHTSTGGFERADSVASGLQYILQKTTPNSWVLVHDAARPLVALSDIRRLTTTVYNSGAVGGLLATPVQDTLKRADNYCCVDQTIDRYGLWQAQTPQMFRAGQLYEALLAADQVVTDEASAMESAGYEPQLVEALQPNFKITRPMDMKLAEALLRNTMETA